MDNDIVLLETGDKEIKLSVPIEQETVWLTQTQMVELFERDISVNPISCEIQTRRRVS